MKPFELSIRIVGLNSKQKATSMNDHSAIGEAARDLVVESISDPEGLSEMEDQVRRMMYWLGNMMLHLWLMWLSMKYPPSNGRC